MLLASMLPLAAMVFISVALADPVEDVTRLHRSADTISIATGHTQPLNVAPAVATVITAEELDAVGATTISDAMALVPGVNVLYRSQGSHFIFRGVRADSNFNPDWLLMVDGIPQNDVGLGNQRLFIGDVPLQNIDRIEVIRGPGSALYGTDAFAGVINVITKRPSGVSDSEIRLRGGSFDTGEGRFLVPGQIGDAKSLFSLQVRTTDGFRPLVEADGQSAFDRQLGTSASLAPGRAQTWQDDYNFLVDLEKDAWRLRLRRWAHELGVAGLAGSLDDKGWRKSDMNSVDIIYDRKDYAPDWDVKFIASWYDISVDTFDVQAYPPGAFGGLFPNGVLDNPGYSESRYHTEASVFYKGWQRHAVTLGAGADKHNVYSVTETRNYQLVSGVPVPLASMVSLDNSQTFIPTAKREVYFSYIQDEWSLASDWTLTYGLRWDHYSDFGSTTNPRMALVWATDVDITTKFLVGRAFRAPTFTDLYSQNNPSLSGNPDLQPELITTYEIAFDYHPHPRLNIGLNIFHHEIDDKIHAVRRPNGTREENVGHQKGNGGEVEFQWIASSNVTLNGWYAHQRNVLTDTDTDAGFAPRNSANLCIDWRFMPMWYWNNSVLWVADRERQARDLRAAVADYTFFHTTLRYKPKKSWSASLSIFNLFDETAHDPSNATGFTDHALPARSVFVEYRLDL